MRGMPTHGRSERALGFSDLWGALRPGRLPSPGHDHTAGHLRYVEQAGDHGRHYLATKPFDAPPTHELPYALRTFSHVVELLDLDLRAQVLDAGCGPGWLTEFLARCGYWVTGVDVSPDMIAIARRRVESLPTDAGLGVAPMAELVAMPVADIPWKRRFDAVIVNDSLHHFDDEAGTLTALRESLVPGGVLFIQEAAWPRRRRDARVYAEEMERHGTLESPFRPGYLKRTLRRSGFTNVRRLAPIDRVFEAGAVVRALRHTLGRTLFPTTNTFMAQAPEPEEGLPDFAGRLVVHDPRVGSDGEVGFELRIANCGRRYWPSASRHPLPVGVVTVAAYVTSASGDRNDLTRIAIPTSLAPGESVSTRATVQLPEGCRTPVYLALVREGVAWFAGPHSLPVTVEP